MFRIRILSCIIILHKLRIISFNKDNNDLYKKRELIFDDLLNQLLAFISQVGLTCPPNPSQVTRVDPYAPRMGFRQFLMCATNAFIHGYNKRQGSLAHPSFSPTFKVYTWRGHTLNFSTRRGYHISQSCMQCPLYILYTCVIGELILNDMTKIIMYTNNGQYI